MSNVVTSPYMQLPVPIVSVTPGPEWASDINGCMALIDSHDHSTGQGVPVTPAGININADLSFNDVNNIIDVRTVRFYSLIGDLVGAPDLGCIYVVGNELFYNSTSNQQVQITLNGSVNAGPGSITGLPSGTASASFVAASGTFVWQQSTGQGANMDSAALILRYPSEGYPTPAGNFICIAPPSSLATGYFLYLPALPAATKIMTLNTTGHIVADYDVDNATIGLTSNNIYILPGGVNTTQLAAQAVTSAKIANNNVTQQQLYVRAASSSPVAIGNIGVTSYGSLNQSITVETPIPGQTGTITTTGRPLRIDIINNPGPPGSYITFDGCYLICYVDGLIVGMIQSGPAGYFGCSNFLAEPAAGDHNISITVSPIGGGSPAANIQRFRIMYYEMI